MDALRNVEIKAKIKDIAHVRKIAEKLSENPDLNEVLKQSDQFYDSPHGSRLKLRREDGRTPRLVWYSRSDIAGPKLSTYRLFSMNDDRQAEELDLLLADCYGHSGKLEKTRFLYLVGQTRVHVDQVEGLGDFMELEVVLRPDQSLEEGQEIANNLMKKLGVAEEDLITGSYMEMFHKIHSK